MDWSDGIMTATRTDLAVAGDITVTANFAINVVTYTLTYTAGANGSISGTSPQTVTAGSDGAPVTAVADPGYHFVNWSDGVTTATRTDLAVADDITVTANFAIDTMVTVSQGVDIGRPTARYFASRDATCVVDEITVSTSGAPSTISTLTVRGLDSSDTLTTDVSAVSLYRDSGILGVAGQFDETDIQLGTAQSFSSDASGTAVVFSSVNALVDPARAGIDLDRLPYGSHRRRRACGGQPTALRRRRAWPQGIRRRSLTMTSANNGQTVGFDFSPPSTEASGVAAGWSSCDRDDLAVGDGHVLWCRRDVLRDRRWRVRAVLGAVRSVDRGHDDRRLSGRRTRPATLRRR